MHVESAERGTPGWPDGMTIHVDDFDHELGPLVFSRSAWGLDIDLPIPEVLVVPPPTRAPRPVLRPELDADWRRAWELRLAHIGDFDDFEVEEEGLDAFFDAVRARDGLLPTPWQDRMSSAFDETYEEWSDAVRERIRPGVRLPLVSLFARAWRTGLDHFSVVPFEGHYGQRLTRRRALVSATTWNDDDLMARALTGWSAAP